MRHPILPALALVLAAACGSSPSDPNTPPPPPPPPPPANDGMVGAAGGTLDFAGGAVQLVVPAGAVSTNTTITVTSQQQASAAAPAGRQVVGPVYVLGPAGTTFAKPVTVKLSYQPSNLPAWVMSGDLSLLQFDGIQWSGLTDIAVDGDHHTISGRLMAIAGSRAAGIHASTMGSAGLLGAGSGGGTTVGIGAQDPVVTLTPASASVNAQQRYAKLTMDLAPRGTAVPLPATATPLLYRWSTTGRNGAISTGPGIAWDTITTVQYTATSPQLAQLSGPIDTVTVEVLLNPASRNDPPSQRIVTASATIDADLQLTYDITPSLPTIAQGTSTNLQLLIRDKQGQQVALPTGQDVTWTNSADFGTLGAVAPRQMAVTYTAFTRLNAPPPRIDDVVAKVTEFKRSIIRTAIPGPFGFVGFKEDTVDRTLLHGEAKALVEVAVQYQVVVTPSAATVAGGGTVDLDVTLDPAYTGPGLGYKFTNPGVHGTLDVANNTLVSQGQVTYTAKTGSPGTDVIQVEVFSVTAGVPLESLGTAQASITVDPFPAWKFTALNVQFAVIQTVNVPNTDQQICYQCWRLDSLMWVRLRDHQNEGGLMYVPAAATIDGVAAPQGLYLLEGTNITKARLGTDFDFGPAGLTGVAPTPGRIKTQWLVNWLASPRVSQADPSLNEGYLDTGDITHGAIQGLVWGPANPNLGFPFNLRQATVDFTGDIATGTLTYEYRLYLGGSGFSETWRSEVTVTFTAQRLH